MPQNGVRELEQTINRYSIGDKVRDRSGQLFEVQQVGMKYLIVNAVGDNPSNTMTLKKADIYKPEPGSMND